MSSSNPTPGQSRELVFCHSCQEEWYRDEFGIVCPHCHSDFTEIIEQDHDPRPTHAPHLPDLDDVDDYFPFPSAAAASARNNPFPPNHPLHQTFAQSNWQHSHRDHHPAPDPDEPDVGSLGWQSHGPGQFSYSSTVNFPGGHGHGHGQNPHGGGGMPDGSGGLVGPLMGLLHNVMGRGSSRPPGSAPTVQGGTRTITHSFPGGGVRITTTSTSGFTPFAGPRDGHGPHEGDTHVSELNQMLGDIFGTMPTQHPLGNQQPNGPGPPPGGLSLLFQLLAGGPGGQIGDAVYSQEAFDRILSQLMEQNASGNAPGPATEDAITTLPKRKVDKELLGDSGKAECSICMDEVSLGEEVTEMYCGHWFHTTCITAWLNEHNTCPHCRMGIEEAKEKAREKGKNASVGGSQSSSKNATKGSSSSRGAPASRDAPSPTAATRGSSSASSHRSRDWDDPPSPPVPNWDSHPRRSHSTSEGNTRRRLSPFHRSTDSSMRPPPPPPPAQTSQLNPDYVSPRQRSTRETSDSGRTSSRQSSRRESDHRRRSGDRPTESERERELDRRSSAERRRRASGGFTDRVRNFFVGSGGSGGPANGS